MRQSEAAAPLPALVVAPRGNFGRDLSNWLFPIYLAVILLGFWQIKASTPGASNGSRALFTAINAATLTGFENGFPIDKSLTNGGQLAVLALVISGSLFSMLVGSLAMTRILALRFSDRQVIESALLAEASAVLIGAVVLYQPGATGGSTAAAIEALLRGASAFGNCGVYAGTIPAADQISTHLALLPLSILGGLGLPVLMELAGRARSSIPLSRHSWTTLAMTGWIYVIGMGLLLLLDVTSRGSLTSDGILRSSATVLESRTLGLPLVTVKTFARVGQWLVIAIMAIGASSAGTGGGLKTTTVAELIRGARAAISGNPVTRGFGFALAWLASYAGIVFGGAMLLSFVMPEASADGVLFNAVSSASNVGLSPAEIPDRANVYYALAAIMLMGRMAPPMILWWMAESGVEGDLGIG